MTVITSYKLGDKVIVLAQNIGSRDNITNKPRTTKNKERIKVEKK
jgi:hypothetical protein